MTSDTQATSKPSQIAQSVRAEMSRVFVERLTDSAFAAPLGIAIAGWLIYSSAGISPAMVWSFVMIALEFLIVFVGTGYKRAIGRNANSQMWLHGQLAIAGLVGLWWGSAVWFVWVDGQMLFYVSVLCVLVGVSGICMVTMAPSRKATLLFSLGMLVGPLLQMLWVTNPIAVEIGFGWLMMSFVQAWTGRQLRHELARDIGNAIKNKILLQQLSKATNELQNESAQKEEKNAELALALKQLNTLVSRDQLTGAYSRRYIFEQLDRLVAVRQQNKTPISAVMIDLDNFKAINDTYGHQTGDLALQQVVLALEAQLREGDLLARLGGEEFLVVLPMSDLNSAMAMGETLRRTLESTTLQLSDGQGIPLPASFGVAELQDGEDQSRWLCRIDSALYQAKSQGRNGVIASV